MIIPVSSENYAVWRYKLNDKRVFFDFVECTNYILLKSRYVCLLQTQLLKIALYIQYYSSWEIFGL